MRIRWRNIATVILTLLAGIYGFTFWKNIPVAGEALIHLGHRRMSPDQVMQGVLASIALVLAGMGLIKILLFYRRKP